MPIQSNSVFGSDVTDGRFPRLTARRDLGSNDAIISKLVSQSDNPISNKRNANRELRAPDLGLLQRLSDATGGNVTDADNLLQLLPDTELAMQILISSILSPKDMMRPEINFSVEGSLFTSEQAGQLLTVIREHFEGTYKIGKLLPTILEDALFRTGSYPLAIIPETTIDDVINSPNRVSMEALRGEFTAEGLTHVGILGTPVSKEEQNATFGLESLSKAVAGTSGITYSPKVKIGPLDLHLNIVDNVNALKIPMLKDKIRQDRLNDVLSSHRLSMEVFNGPYSVKKANEQDQNDVSLYRRRRYRSVPILALTPADRLERKSVGHPLVMKLPSESVIPVHVPSDPKEHIGYFVLLDQHGNPITRSTSNDYYQDLRNTLTTSQPMVSQMLQAARAHTEGRDVNKTQDVEELQRIYTDLVEHELLERLKSGIYGDNVKIGRPEEVYRIMMSRSFARMNTQVLFIPVEQMTYVAFDWDEYGIGRSLLTKSKILGSIRAMLMFANTMAAIKNSVGHTELAIQLDPEDPDPSTTVEFLRHEYARARQNMFPLGASSPVDMISYLQNAGVELSVTGNTRYPEVKMSVEDKASNRTKTDPDLEKMIKERYIMSLGLSPETVDNSANPEFATSVVSNNLLLAKRVMLYQEELMAFTQDIVQKITLNSSLLMDKLREIVRANTNDLKKELIGNTSQLDEKQIDAIVFQFVNSLRTSLPAPDVGSLDNQMRTFDAYVEGLDKVLRAYLDTTFLESNGMGELTDVLEPTIAAVRAYYIRQWLRNNNVMPELDALTTFNEEDGPAVNMLEVMRGHMEGISKSLEDYMRKMLENRAKRDKQAKEIQEETGVETTPSGGGSNSTASGGGGDDFGDIDNGDTGVDGGSQDSDDTSDDEDDQLPDE